MDVIDLTDDSPPAPLDSEPIGVHVSVDILDLTEGQSDKEEEMQAVPQHLDWNDIAEQRAAHAAFQALRSYPNVAPPPPLVRRRQRPPIQGGTTNRNRTKNKRKRRQSQQSAGESSSLQRQKKRRKKACDPNANGDARRNNNNGRKQAGKKHPNKRRDEIRKKTKEMPKNAPGMDDKDNTEAAAMRKREQKRRKNQRRRRNLAARKRAKEQAKREESEQKIASPVESPSGSFGAKTSESNDKLSATREPLAVSRKDEKPSAVQSETQRPQESTISIGIFEVNSKKSESVAKKWAPKPPPAVSQLNGGDLTARDHCRPRDVQLETQQNQDSEISSHSCVNTAVESDTIVGAARKSVRDPPSSVSHVAAEKHSQGLCVHAQPEKQPQEYSLDSSGANVSTALKSDIIASNLDDTDSESEINVNSQSGRSSNPDRKETVSSIIGENDGNNKSVLAESDHKARETSDADEPQTLPVQNAAPPQEKIQTEQSAKKSIDVSDEKHDQLEHDHVSLSSKRDGRFGDDESSAKNASTSLRTGEESPCKMNGTIGRRQDSGHGKESTTTPYTNPKVSVIDGVENEKEQDETKAQPSKPGSGQKSLPAKRQSQTASSSSPVAVGMNNPPTMKDLIDANAGARDKKRAKTKKHSGTKKQGERKSWQSTVIIVETSDEEEEDDSDATDIGDTAERDPEVVFLKTALPAKKRKRRGRPTNPATKFKKYPPKREPLEQHLRTNGQYNFHYTEEEAAREQERLFKQAADRLRQNASMANQASGTAAASVPRGINDLSHDHWRSPDLYLRLGLPPGAPIQLVKRQYRRLALRYHPDKGWKDVHTTDRFQAITEAYKVLCGECERL